MAREAVERLQHEPTKHHQPGEVGEYRPIAEIVEELDALEGEARETDKALKAILAKIMT